MSDIRITAQAWWLHNTGAAGDPLDHEGRVRKDESVAMAVRPRCLEIRYSLSARTGLLFFVKI